ncbi:MAG: flippase-like domain-containing protein [Magnetococcus sp. DMHC-6]
MHAHRLWLILKICFATSVMIFLFWHIGPFLIWQTLQRASLPWVGAAAITLAVSLLLNGLSLYALFLSAWQLKLKHFLHLFFLSTLLAFWVPGRIGDFSIGLLLKNEVPLADSLLYVLVDKIITLFVVSFLAVVGCFYYWPPIIGSIALFGMILLWGTLFLLYHYPNWWHWSLRKIPVRWRIVPLRFEAMVILFSGSGQCWLWWNLALTCGRLLMSAATAYFLIWAFGNEISFTPILLAIAPVTLLSLLPISIQGMGVTESAYLYFLTPEGVSQGAILAFCLVARLLTWVAVFGFYVGTAHEKHQRYQKN